MVQVAKKRAGRICRFIVLIGDATTVWGHWTAGGESAPPTGEMSLPQSETATFHRIDLRISSPLSLPCFRDQRTSLPPTNLWRLFYIAVGRSSLPDMKYQSSSIEKVPNVAISLYRLLFLVRRLRQTRMRRIPIKHQIRDTKNRRTEKPSSIRSLFQNS